MGLSFGASSAVRRAAAAAVLASSLMVAPSLAWADESAAETFFQEGINAMKRSDYTVACDAFAKSNKADPSPGTQINLALCFEKQKKWASAWTWYRSAFGLAQQRGQKEREQLADEAANRIRSQIHYVVVAVKEPLADLVVRRDGSEVATMLAGKDIPLPIDPGEHTLEVSAKGKKPWKHTFSVPDNASTDTIQVPKLENDDAPAAVTTRDDTGRVESSGRGDGQRLTGMLLGGAGLLAGIGSGVAFWLAKDQESERDARYEEAAQKPEAERPAIVDSAKSFHDAAIKDQLIAFGLLGGGAVLVGVGAIVYFTAPKAAKTAAATHFVPLLSPTAAGMGLGGTF